ncbi:MAG: 4Fe-4S binding protein [Deltaproteobacteria bacterium]|nr:4Fe-4S binding protein [Deltaproteobacteria bacterium]
MNEADYKELKKGGMMRQREAGLFSVRLHVVGGQLTTAQLAAVRKAADRFGRGEVHLTTRQGVEIPFVPTESLAAIKAFLADSGVGVGVCGPTVRTVTACQGCRICPSGAIDAADLARRIDREFYGAKVPHKFKVSISGCANNCMKAEENDIGVKGWIAPRWTQDPCTFCGACESACPTKVIRVSEGDGLVTINLDGCIGCGDCIAVCPSGAMSEEAIGYRLFAGGKFGRLPLLGKPILGVLRSADEVIAAIRSAIDFFRVHGEPRERFGDTLQRTGLRALEDHIRERTALSA